MFDVSPASPIRTTCPYCGVGCGLEVRPDGRGGAGRRGVGVQMAGRPGDARGQGAGALQYGATEGLPALREAMGQRALARVQQAGGWKQYGEAAIGLYQSLLGQPAKA